MSQTLPERAPARPAPRPSPGGPGAAPEDGGRRLARLALVAALLSGALLRLLQYAANRALWLDEAQLASSIVGRDAAALLEPLDYVQTAPLGFLLLEKAAVSLLGATEYALRLVPLLGGLAALFLAPRVARRYVSREALPLAVALFALAPFLVYYSSEVKQYSLDALVALAVLLCAAELQRRRPRRGWTAAFLAVGVVGVWLSQPAVFLLAGTGIVLLAERLRRGDRRGFARLAGVAAAWGASFAGAYAVSRMTLNDPEYMQVFWKKGFWPLPPRSPADWVWLPERFAHIFREPLGIAGEDTSPLSVLAAVAGMAAFALGVRATARSPRRRRLALLLAPPGLALVASALRVYPFGSGYLAGGRVLIWLVPAFTLLMAEGAAWAGRQRPRAWGRAAFALLAALMLAPSLAYAALSVPQPRNEVKPLLAYAAGHRRPGDLLYVYYNGSAAFDFYGHRYGWDAGNTVIGRCARLNPAEYLPDLARLRGRERVWVLFVDGKAVLGYDERALMVRYLEHVGRRLDDQVSVGAYLYLYDLRPEHARPEPFRARAPVFPYDAAMACRGPWGPK